MIRLESPPFSSTIRKSERERRRERERVRDIDTKGERIEEEILLHNEDFKQDKTVQKTETVT